MKLYTSEGNPTGRKVEAVLKHIGLDYETKILSFEEGEMRGDAFRQINPSGLIPTLEDGGRKIWESNAIITYLCTAKSPDHDLFKPEFRSKIMQWMFWEVAQYNAALRMIVWETFVKPRFNLGETNDGVVQAGQENFVRWAGVLNDHLEGREFMVGNDWTLADYAVGYLEPIVGNLPIDLTPFTNIQGFYERMAKNPHWAATALDESEKAA
jgi:glutathione S-transferase